MPDRYLFYPLLSYNFAIKSVQYQDMGYSLFSGHRLHSAGVVHPFHTQSHFRHNIVDLVRLQLITANVIEAEEQVIHPNVLLIKICL